MGGRVGILVLGGGEQFLPARPRESDSANSQDAGLNGNRQVSVHRKHPPPLSRLPVSSLITLM